MRNNPEESQRVGKAQFPILLHPILMGRFLLSINAGDSIEDSESVHLSPNAFRTSKYKGKDLTLSFLSFDSAYKPNRKKTRLFQKKQLRRKKTHEEDRECPQLVLFLFTAHGTELTLVSLKFPR